MVTREKALRCYWPHSHQDNYNAATYLTASWLPEIPCGLFITKKDKILTVIVHIFTQICNQIMPQKMFCTDIAVVPKQTCALLMLCCCIWKLHKPPEPRWFQLVSFILAHFPQFLLMDCLKMMVDQATSKIWNTSLHHISQGPPEPQSCRWLKCHLQDCVYKKCLLQ